MFEQETETNPIETINVKIPYELYEKIKDHPELRSYPIEILDFESKFVKESCVKVEQIQNEIEALNDFWLDVLQEKPVKLEAEKTTG